MQAGAKETRTMILPAMDQPPVTEAHTGWTGSPSGRNVGTTILQPGTIPKGHSRDLDVDRDVCGVGCGAGTGIVPGAIGSGFSGPTIHVVTPRVVTERPPRISVMNLGAPIERPAPVYPPIARQTGRQGDVVLLAIIGKDGRIAGVQIKSGDPLLAGAAVLAVKGWRYRPYILNGEPIEVETQVTISFRLAR
jgi:TonB family protein